MWRLTPGQRLRLRGFGDESVLYNDLSGDTHLLGGSAIHLLELLGQHQAPDQMLLDSLATAIGCARGDAFDAEAGALLTQLSSLFLIEQYQC
ncbi:MAG: HPr-rel-A system PqqD family peptide chaperone [Bdellovibrionales bacterium]|nr:HPr-rel-A system PqqD family peptide chaperone [Massilia sp.]